MEKFILYYSQFFSTYLNTETPEVFATQIVYHQTYKYNIYYVQYNNLLKYTFNSIQIT